MTDEMDRTADDRWLPESDGDATQAGDGDFPSFEEALRAHGFEVAPPKIPAEPGMVGPESDEDDELRVDDDSTAPILADARGWKAPVREPADLESSPAALAASWIPRTSVAPKPAAPGGSVFGTVLARLSAVSAPWVTAPEPEIAPEPEVAPEPEAGEATVAEEVAEAEEATVAEVVAEAEEAPAWTEGEAGIDMTTAEVTEAWDLEATAVPDAVAEPATPAIEADPVAAPEAAAAGRDGAPEPGAPFVDRRTTRPRHRDKAMAVEVAAAVAEGPAPDAEAVVQADASAEPEPAVEPEMAAEPEAATEPEAAAPDERPTDTEPVWTAGEAGVVEMTNDEVTEAWDTGAEPADAAAQAAADEVEDRWWIEPEATPEGAGPKLPQAPATLTELRPPVPPPSLFAARLTSAQADTQETAETSKTADRVAGTEFVGYDREAARAAAASAASAASGSPSTEPAVELAEPAAEPAVPAPEPEAPAAPGAPMDDFEARLRSATEPLGYPSPSEKPALDPSATQADEWSPSAATWEELHDDPWAAQTVGDRVAPPHEREPFTYEVPVAPPPEPRAPPDEPSVETPPVPATADSGSSASAPISNGSDTQATQASAAIPRTPTAPARPSLPPTPPSLLRPPVRSSSAAPAVFERVAARPAEPAARAGGRPESLAPGRADAASAGSATSSSASERGDLWHLVSEKTDAGATTAPTAPDRITIFLTVLVSIVIVLLVLGFIALFTNFFH